MGRPLGEIARAALSLLEIEPLTARELANRLQASERTIKNVCYRLQSAGRAQIIRRERVRYARRRVALYASAQVASSIALESVWR